LRCVLTLDIRASFHCASAIAVAADDDGAMIRHAMRCHDMPLPHDSIYRVKNEHEMNRIIANKNRENAKELERRKKAREARRVLESGGTRSIGGAREEL